MADRPTIVSGLTTAPALLDPAAVASPSAPEPGTGPGAQAANVEARRRVEGAVQGLLIEDLPRVQQILRDVVEEPGLYEVCAVADGEAQAIADFDRLQPHAVIIDLKLRQGSGLGFLQSVRARKLAAQPLLIVITNHALPVLETACRQAGADHFLDKSRDLGRLRGLMDQAFGRA